jgi:hypothetical protein
VKTFLFILILLSFTSANAGINIFLNKDGIDFIKKNRNIIQPYNDNLTDFFYIGGGTNSLGEDPCILEKDVYRIKQYIEKVSISGDLKKYPECLSGLENMVAIEICCFMKMPQDLFKKISTSKNLNSVIFNFPYDKAKYSIKKLFLLSEIKNLSLAGHKLDKIPDDIFLMKNLTTLDFSGNSLSQWPSKLCDLKQLSSINFNGNKFTQIDSILEQTSCLQNLQYLYFNNNPIDSASTDIKKSKNIMIQLDYK